jgi:hypothetical protein
LRRCFAFTCIAALLLGSSAQAGSTIFQFIQVNDNDTVTATDNGSGTTTLTTNGNIDGGFVSIPVLVQTSYVGSGPFVAFETFVGVTSNGPATIDPSSGQPEQKFSGEIEFTAGPGGAGQNYLTAVFSSFTFSPVLQGQPGGAQASLTAAEPPDNLVLTAQGISFGNPTGMTIGFSNISPGLSIDLSDNTIASFTGQNSGTFSAAVVPEPGTLCLASFAVVIGAVAYRKTRMKAKAEA